MDYMKTKTPTLRYVGAKWQISDWIISKFPVHKIYVEPYAGSSAVFFRKPKTHLEVLNDMDGDLVNFFRVLRERTTELATAIELTPYSREEYELSLQPCSDPLERARRFYVAAWQSFGSTLVYRSGWRRMTKSENWKSLTAQFKRMDGVLYAADRLRDAQIENKNALDIITEYDSPDTLFYIDPPYVFSSRSSGARKRYKHEVDDKHHHNLAATLKNLKGYAILSGYDSDLYNQLYHGWGVDEKSTTTNGNGQAIEKIWLSPRLTKWLQANIPQQQTLI